MGKLNKKDLFEQIAESEHISKKEAKAAVEKVFSLIENSLLEGEEVNITNFGVFTPKKRANRVGGHPKTHERMSIEGSTTVVFRTSKALKAKLNK